MKRELREKLDAWLSDDSVPASDIPPELVTGYRGIYNRVVKRGLDFILALVLFIVTLPVQLVISVLIIADSGFPVFYRALRGGYRQKAFRIFKFRTMVKNADQIGGGTTALHDRRVTRVGEFLRRTKLDEFANLLSILAGNMSFIGPRPELLQYTEQYSRVSSKVQKNFFIASALV